MTLMTFDNQNFVNEPKPSCSCGVFLCGFVRPVRKSDAFWDGALLGNSCMSWPVEGTWGLLKCGNIQAVSQIGTLHTGP